MPRPRIILTQKQIDYIENNPRLSVRVKADYLGLNRSVVQKYQKRNNIPSSCTKNPIDKKPGILVNGFFNVEDYAKKHII